MSRSTPRSLAGRRAPLRRALVGAALALTALGLSVPSAHAGPAAPDVPSQLVPVGDYKPFLVGHAVGWQVHTCLPTATGHAWSFDGPVASLYDDNGKLLATHAAGPTWTARDGSSVGGAVVSRATVSPTAIPWLLLSTTPRPGGPVDGRLTATTHIQRIATTGGLTPAAAECTAATVGETRRVPYTADYVFWKTTGAAA